ncbi:MAG TPA: FkbM family methyltransferase [Bacteroidia bacterium]|nr:FkbM family methyltransferase [Bacteroidia bacterium]
MDIHLRNISYKVDAQEHEAAWNHIGAGKWESKTFDILDQFISKDDVVLDIGAWAGPISLYAAHIASRVYAIEPDPAIFSQLEKNVSLNPELASKITCRKVAITNQNEFLPLYARSKYGESSSSLLARIRDDLFTERVQGMTIRKFIDSEKTEQIDFIKIDIEGGEFSLLPGLADDLQKMNFPTIYISFHYSFLSEHQYLLKVRSKMISRIGMKIEKYFQLDFFRKSNRRAILDTLRPLKAYKYVYTDSGQEISFSSLLSDPLLIKKHNLVFTNKKWNKIN